MLLIKYNGWFQCMLATDPDPSDETRGVSGMIRVYPGEPDLDRVIKFQPPFHRRSHTPEPGVFVRAVFSEDGNSPHHPLLGARVDLLGKPVFKGENGIVAEDGKEPIVPFQLELATDRLRLSREPARVAEFQKFPFLGLQAQAIVNAPGLMRATTGIYDVDAYFGERVAQLRSDLKGTTDPLQQEILSRRIGFLEGGSVGKFFPVYMPYSVPLKGEGVVEDQDDLLKGTIRLEQSWTTDLLFGAWDADALCGFVEGYLTIV